MNPQHHDVLHSAKIAQLPVCNGKRVVELAQDVHDSSVGSVVWPCALHVLDEAESAPRMKQVLGASLEAVDHPLAGVKVLECGSGTGIVGLGLAMLGADVTVSDYAPCMDLLHLNVELMNKRSVDRPPVEVKCVEVDWNHLDRATVDFSSFDVLLLVECVYEPSNIGDSPVVRLVSSFLAGGADKRAIICFEERDADIETSVMEQLTARHLHPHVVARSGCVAPSEGNAKQGHVHYVTVVATSSKTTV